MRFTDDIEGIIGKLLRDYFASSRRNGLLQGRDDIENIARYVVFDAKTKFDENFGAKFTTYVYKAIQNRLKDVRRKELKEDFVVLEHLLAQDEAEHHREQLRGIIEHEDINPFSRVEMKLDLERSLTKREMRIFNWFYHEGWNKTDIAKKIAQADGVSQSHASRELQIIFSRITRKIQELERVYATSCRDSLSPK